MATKKKSSGKRSAARTKSTSRRYGPKAAERVERAMHEFKRGELESGGTGKPVKSRKQAIAIGLSEARRAGGKVPSPRSARSGGSRKKK